MSRIIKFRAWDKINKKMLLPDVPIPGSKVTNSDFMIHGSGGILSLQESNGFLKIIPLEKSNLVLLQFTGLLDSKGNEIYEGDVIQLNSFSEDLIIVPWVKGEIIFNNGMFKVDTKRRLEFFTEKERGTYTLCHVFDLSEIIGNIYENPELLEN